MTMIGCNPMRQSPAPFHTPVRVRLLPGLGRCHISSSGKFALERSSNPSPLASHDDVSNSLAAERLFALSEKAQEAARRAEVDCLDYLILVPTLRCNLSCSYCQVSRAPVDQPGFDWSEETLGHVIRLLEALPRLPRTVRRGCGTRCGGGGNHRRVLPVDRFALRLHGRLLGTRSGVCLAPR